MKLSTSSWHFRLHKILYGRYAKIPTNYCPYFWKTIVLGVLFVVPLMIFYVPTRIIEMLTPEDWDDPDLDEQGYFSPYLVYAIFVNLIITIGISMIGMWFQSWSSTFTFMQGAGLVGWILVFILFLVYLRSKWLDRRGKRIVAGIREKKPNLLVEGVKAWYKRHCPIIEWEGGVEGREVAGREVGRREIGGAGSGLGEND